MFINTSSMQQLRLSFVGVNVSDFVEVFLLLSALSSMHTPIKEYTT